MEKYGSHSFNGNYDGYRYPPPNNINNTQPPLPLSPQPSHVYPYSPSYSVPYPEQPPYSNNFGPLNHQSPSFHSPYQPPYPYPNSNPPYTNPNSSFLYPPQPSLQYQGSFQYGFVCPGYRHNYPPLPSRNESFHSYHRQESLSSLGASPSNHDLVNAYPSDATSSSTLYPLDDLMSSIHLSDPNQASSRPESPLLSNLTRPGFQSMSPGYERAGVYGYPNHSFPSTSDQYYNPVLQHSGELSSHSFCASPASSNGSQHGQSLQVVPFEKSKASLKVLLLHGSLEVLIIEAKNLPNMDLFHRKLADVFGKNLTTSVSSKIEAHVPHRPKITSDPYVSFSVSNAVLGRTYVISNSENPIWNQHFCVPVAHYTSEVCFIVKDNDVVGSQLIGNVVIPAERIYTGEKFEGSFPIMGANGKACKPGAVLSLSIQYISIEKLTMFSHGVGMGPNYDGVPGTYFPLRKGGKVTLYQDAHVPEGSLPDLKLDQGMRYVHGQCWQDIFDAISQATRFIYITGWSVYYKVKLVRDASYASECTLGDLLKSKSQEGVRVLLLVWDDPTSRSILGYQMDGVMQTHDEETRRFFKHSSVQVLLVPRSAGKRHSWFKQQEVGTFFTHHQKTVVVDSDAGNRKRKIIAFVGGLDLCDGRYDTPSHPLFRTSQTEHIDDFHNPTFGVPNIGCPREPWHDLHCKIDGPAAYDVLTNFQDRWLKASKPHGIEKLKRSFDDALLKIERIHDIIWIPAAAPCLNENDPEAWHVQVFRSIDSNSVKGFPKDPKHATCKNLVCGKNVLIDRSIHTAYVTAIRAAQHFIYIENQYFYGSSYNWASHNDIGCDNLIPMEIALKIANKIKANERFSAYIVIPMWPEGVPTSIPTQRILFWQNKTMRMMYEIVYKALEEVGLQKTYEPQDYLNFFCLGNREALEGNGATYGTPTTANTPHELSRRSRRFMIYVHSKGMIVDDEYVILGSANINQRSMDGSRDTEIAMGAYQPQHTWARKGASPHGQIYGYRMSLWAEHIGSLEEIFTRPESLECVKRVRAMGELNWKQFAADEVTEMRGHLLKYPVQVDARGKVKPLPGCEMFPDVGGRIVGSFTAIQENLTT